MKIAISVSHFPQLAETFILNRITGLIDLGHEVDIYAYGPGIGHVIHGDVTKYYLTKNVNYFSIPQNRLERVVVGLPKIISGLARNPNLMLKSLNLFRYKKETLSLNLPMGAACLTNAPRYDIIHSHHGPNGLKDVWLKDAGAWSGKHITSFHGADISRHIKLHGRDVYKVLFQKGDLFLPVSNRMKQKLIELGCDESKIIVHHSGIDLNVFRTRPFKTMKPSETINVLSTGRLVEKKGLQFAIEAMAKWIESGQKVNYKIIGEGEERGRLEALIQKLGIKDSVQLLGAKPQASVNEALIGADIFLAPSIVASDGNEEGIPNTIKEAMAVGVPVVSTKHGAIQELIEHEKQGFLSIERNSEDLTQKLRLCANKETLRLSCIEAARMKVEKEYDVMQLNKRLIAIYTDLVQE